MFKVFTVFIISCLDGVHFIENLCIDRYMWILKMKH
jgi:hypothetical protein